MNNTRRATLVWSLGAVVFSLTGVYIALSVNGAWYSVVSAVLVLLAGAAFAARRFYPCGHLPGQFNLDTGLSSRSRIDGS
ncbi:hypothetical protein FJ661_20575 [Pseudarthrobacter phenanthrenivorans]|uniref:hypothetical protein n=1 Tax=Pseudarthrobacter phenanthrenivorans TaxID=361575 RepID=UPI00112D8B9A|nr:hypothetical protein [Pseudarthrobacter phenanthrenivorans]TPV47580.1 hypothetical protein FJ661_20575 [Pseudarthrobacter phenanthrenivorans]